MGLKSLPACLVLCSEACSSLYRQEIPVKREYFIWEHSCLFLPQLPASWRDCIPHIFPPFPKQGVSPKYFYFKNQLATPFASELEWGASGNDQHPYINLRQPPTLCLWVPHPGKLPKFSDAFCYPCATCRCFSSLYISREGKDSREKQAPDPKQSLNLTRLQTPLLLRSAKWDFPNYHSSLPNRRLVPENLPRIWFYFMERAIVIVLPKWRFVFAGNVLSLTHIAIIVWLSLPLIATKLRKP